MLGLLLAAALALAATARYRRQAVYLPARSVEIERTVICAALDNDRIVLGAASGP